MRARSCLVFVLFAACDPSAKVQPKGDPAGGAATARPSSEYESCAATADCAGALRCFAGECRSAQQSVVGEVYAAVGDKKVLAGDFAASDEFYGRAVAEYQHDGIAVPAQLVCGLARARAQLRGSGQQSEAAASQLHRCLLATEPGSPLHAQAFADLAGLLELGLDPALLRGTATVDRYLTKAPAVPAPSALTIAVTADRKGSEPAFTEILRALGSDPAVQAAIDGCATSYFQASRNHRVELALHLKHHYRLDANDDFDRAILETSVGTPSPEPQIAAAVACVRDQLGPLLDERARKLGEEERWEAGVTITVSD